MSPFQGRRITLYTKFEAFALLPLFHNGLKIPAYVIVSILALGDDSDLVGTALKVQDWSTAFYVLV